MLSNLTCQSPLINKNAFLSNHHLSTKKDVFCSQIKRKKYSNLFAKANDNSNSVATSQAVNITLTSNALQTVSITSPGYNTSYTAPATIHLSASAADSDGTISQVVFYNGASLLATLTQASYIYDWINVQPGSYNLTAKATDNVSGSTTSSNLPVTVISGTADVYCIDSDHKDGKGRTGFDHATEGCVR